MRSQWILLIALVAATGAFDLGRPNDEVQYVKAVKGGHSTYQYRGGDTTRFFGSNTTAQGYGSRPSQAPPVNYEVGVCYIEVPTATLVRDPAHVPAGNGSRPDLSRIRSCCKGYKRNIYNFRLCEPVCTKECVNALCSAPDTCSCFPDHVKNSAGFCVATCPIGCQNGQCAGGECLCKEGFRLDIDGKYCTPYCRNNCGGVGNCTAPNTCACQPGYHPTSDGSCSNSPNSAGPNGYSVPSTQYPKNPQQPNAPGQTNTYYNPQQGTNYPLNTYNQNGPNTPYSQNNSQPSIGPNHNSFNINPQVSSNYPSYPYPQNSSNVQPTNSSNYPQNPYAYNPNYPQGPYSSYPHPNQNSQNNTQHPTYPIMFNATYPSNHPLYPGNQVGNTTNYPNYPQQPHSQYPQGQFGNNGGTSNNLYPSLQTVNITIPSQYPLYPGNQYSPSGPYPSQGNQNHYPNNSTNPYNQGGYPHPNSQPSNPQQEGYYPNQPGSNPQYPYYQGYPHPQGGNYPQQGGSYPGNQYPFDQEHVNTLQCSEECINGVCTAQNQCRCNPGYVRDEDDASGRRCKPNCPGGCPNGYCAAPHSCACDEGFYRDTSVKGRPACVKRIR